MNRYLPWALAIMLAWLYFIVAYNHSWPATCSPDSDGYVVPARLLVDQRSFTRPHESDIEFFSPNWFPTKTKTGSASAADERMASRYPPGLSCLFAPGWALDRVDGVLAINLTMASLTILLVFFLCAQLTGPWPALGAALVWATLPAPAIHSLALDSHTALTLFTLLGFSSLARLHTATDLSPRRQNWLYLGAGFFLACLPALHYAEGIFLGIVTLSLGLRAAWAGLTRRNQTTPGQALRQLGAFLLGALLPLAALASFNTVMFAAPWNTAYALTQESNTLALINVRTNFWAYFAELNGPGLGLFLSLGLLGLLVMCCRRSVRSLGWLFSTCTLALTFLYLCYYFCDESATERFLITIYPILIVAACWLLTLPRRYVAALLIVAAVSCQTYANVSNTAPELIAIRHNLEKAHTAYALVNTAVPAGSVLITGYEAASVLDTYGTWHLVDEAIIMSPFVDRALSHVCLPRERAFSADFELTSATWAAVFKNKTVDQRRPLAWQLINAWRHEQRVFWLTSIPEPFVGLPEGATLQGIASLETLTVIGVGAPVVLPRHRPSPVRPFHSAASGGQGGQDLCLYEIILSQP